MYKVTGRQEFGGVWVDGKPLVTFNRGVGYVATENAANTLKGMGYTVEGKAAMVDPLARMKKDDLKKYAEANGIDLTGVPEKVKDILAAIRKAEMENDHSAGNPPENNSEK